MQPDAIPLWRRGEIVLSTVGQYDNPLQDAQLQVTFTSPSGASHTIDGFWDGGRTWRARVMPDETGRWTWKTKCSNPNDTGLHEQRGEFTCTPALDETRLDRHGAIRVSANHRYLEHADGMPFFWLSDTVWNGPLLSTQDEWDLYVNTRAEQKFTAAQWVTTQWIASPQGDREGRLAFTGHDHIAINPAFFQRLDEKVDALNAAGLLSAPVLLWAARWMRQYSDNAINPGLSLPESQAILLARYMVARWGAHHVLWILNGDGHYDESAERWHAIGRGVFGDREHAPVTLHPGGWRWDQPYFAGESWLDIWGYQSAHKLDEESLRFLTAGPMAHEWNKPPIHPIINLEPPYEDHNDMASDGTRRIDAHAVRRALYTSLLITPTAGVSYGGHGVWGWDQGDALPTAHPLTGVAKRWQDALQLPVAREMPHLFEFFNSFDWWRLRPAPEMVRVQPGDIQPSRAVIAARTDVGDLALVYTPQEQTLQLDLSSVHEKVKPRWFQPATGEYHEARCEGTWQQAQFKTPSADDWVLVLK